MTENNARLKLAKRAEDCANCRSSAYPSEVLLECAAALRSSAEPVASSAREDDARVRSKMLEMGEQTDPAREYLRRMLAEFGDEHYHTCPADNDSGSCDCFAGLLVTKALAALSSPPEPTRSIDDVPSCGQENDYRRASSMFKCNCPHEVRSECSEPRCPHYAKSVAPEPTREEIIEECAKFVEQHQESISETSEGSTRYLSPRKVGNLNGIAYVDGLRALTKPRSEARDEQGEGTVAND